MGCHTLVILAPQVRRRLFRANGLYVPLANLLLRMVSLAGKFGLSLTVARYVSLAELGVYGIIFALSMFMVVVLGGRIDHELARQTAVGSDTDVAYLLRDQTAFFLFNFLAALPLFLIAGSLGLPGFGLAIALCTWAICCLESYANLLFVTTNALGQSLLSNVAFFVRSGLWAFIVIALMIAVPETRTLWTVLGFWVVGSALSIAVNLVIVQGRPWPRFRVTPIDWARLRDALRISFPIWIGSIGLAGGTYLDRMVLSAWLDLDSVGVATFYTSFSNAVVTLIASSALAVVVPRLLRTANDKNWATFYQELRSSGWSVLFMGLPLTLAIAVLVPYSGQYLHKAEFLLNRTTLWLLMAGTMVRLLAELANTGLYARRLDRVIWTGNLGFLVVSLIANILFIAWFGLIGLGLANILASLFLLVFRLWGLSSAAHFDGGRHDA